MCTLTSPTQVCLHTDRHVYIHNTHMHADKKLKESVNKVQASSLTLCLYRSIDCKKYAVLINLQWENSRLYIRTHECLSSQLFCKNKLQFKKKPNTQFAKEKKPITNRLIFMRFHFCTMSIRGESKPCESWLTFTKGWGLHKGGRKR